jgi:FKBP-type peptidyl-prolyl cis-trans isomerase
MVLRFLSKLFRKPMKVPPFSMPAEDDSQTTASGIRYQHVQEGTGKQPTAKDDVTVHYAGWLTSGKLFDSSYGRGETIRFPLGGVIKGWTEGVQLMKEGGVTTFVIPAELAYGRRGAPPTIGPDETLVFRVELVKVH